MELNLYPWSILLMPETASGLRGPDLENRMGAETIHVALPSLRSTCDIVHCLCERIFVFDGSSFLKEINKQIPCASQNTEPKALPADVWVFGRFRRLLPTAVHKADCWLDSGVKWWIHVSSIVTYWRKNSFLLRWNSCKQCSESSTAPTLNIAFSLISVHAKWWIYCLLISSTPLLSYATSIYDWPKRVCGVFWCFRDNSRIWATWAFSIIYVCTTAFKVSIPLLNHCFQLSRIRITLIKLLVCLNSIIPIRKLCFIYTRNSNFSIVLKICKVASLKYQ